MAKVTEQPDGSLVIQYTKREQAQLAQVEQVRSMLIKALVGTVKKEACL